jgi:hypothetical protein
MCRLLHKREDALGEVASTSIKDLGMEQCSERVMRRVQLSVPLPAYLCSGLT